MDTIRRDLRYGIRVILSNPGFSALAVLILALGIGVNTAVFSLVDALLLSPLRIEEPRQIVGLYSKNTERPDSYRGFSYPNYVDIRDRNTVFSSLAAHDYSVVGLNEGDSTRQTFAEFISSNYFSTFGVDLLQGRQFTPDEEIPGAAIPVAIVSYGYWNKKGRDPGLVGRTLSINSRLLTIVGIAPEGFSGTMAVLSPEIWLPLGMHEASASDPDGEYRALADRGNHRLYVVGRLERGMSQAEADAQLGVLAAQLEAEFPAENRAHTLINRPRSRLGVGDSPSEPFEIGMVFVLLSAMAGVVLLIACLNLANMMLARAAARRKETAIRLALGCSGKRLVRQLLTEGLVLSFAGGIAGLFFQFLGMRLLVRSFEGVVPVSISLSSGPDLRVLAAMLGFCVLSTLVFALGPAWKCSRANVVPDLKNSAGGDLPRPGERRLLSTRNLLVVGQLSLSLALLAAGGLFSRAALEAARLDPGFSLDDGVLVGLNAGMIGYDESRARMLYADLSERLGALPGVEHASIAVTVPFGNVSLGERVRRAGETPTDESDPRADRSSVSARFNAIGADYFDALDVPLLRGRPFSRAEVENETSSPVAIINQALAQQLFPGEEPLGKRIQYGSPDTERGRRVFEVVGVVPTLKHSLLFSSNASPVSATREPSIYVPFGQEFRFGVHLHVRASPRTGASLAALLPAVRREVRSIDERLPILTLRTLRDHFETSGELWIVESGAKLFSLFGALALFLAAAGVYGVRAYMVSRRTREIGIRLALGATRGDAIGLVMREGLKLTLLGAGIGLALALLAGELLRSILYQVSPTDPVVLAGAVLVLFLASLLACYVPARRAATVNTVLALRSE